MKYITSFIEQDPRKKYPKTEEKRKRIVKILKRFDQSQDFTDLKTLGIINCTYIEYLNRIPKGWAKCYKETRMEKCEECGEPYLMIFGSYANIYYIKEEGGRECVCKECMVKELETLNINPVGYVYARWGI